MSKFYTTSTQAKGLCNEAKAVKEKSKELNNKVLQKKGKVIKLTEELTRLQGVEQKLKNEVEELKENSIEKKTRITHLEVKDQGVTSSMEKAQKEAVAAFIRSDEFKNRLDCHQTAGYEDFRSDAKEAYPEMDFDYFKISTTTKSSLLLTSSEDVNVVDDASTEPAQDATNASKDNPKSGDNAPSGLSQ